MTPEQVHEAVVDQVAAAVDARTAGLFLTSPDGKTASLVRATGYPVAAERFFASLPFDGPQAFPPIECIRRGEALWIDSQDQLVAQYPHLVDLTTPGNRYQTACLPIVVHGRAVGALALTLADVALIDEAERDFLRLVARYSGQALERLRLLDAERASRAAAELLYGLAREVIAAERVEDVFAAALDAIERGLGAGRSSILTYGADPTMRFRAWRGLSDEYRAAVEGHSPWARDTRDPQPIVICDVETDPAMAPYLPLFHTEKIGALAFIPMVAGQKLLGKFMVYYQGARELQAAEIHLASAIADHVAAALTRFAAVGELRETVRFNEMFTGILGHDLRNPLSAIVTAAQLALVRSPNEKVSKPLQRIVNSSGRMARMIEQLLDFTRVRVGEGIPLAPRPIDLVPLVQQVMDELDDANPAWTLSLEQTGDTAGTWDGDRLAQVFSNLIANAVQHGEVAGGVQVRLDGTAPDSLRVEIQNAGVIPPELLPTLFEPLAGGQRRLDRSRGLGLGLHITREIVRAHGGAIGVESDAALGTRFVFTLPRP